MKELLGKKIGEGFYRVIYEHLEDKSLVIKVLKKPGCLHNKNEYSNWVNYKSDLLVPCLSISQDGMYLVQQKGEQTDEVVEAPQLHQSDSHDKGQWVKIDGKLKLCDYGIRLINKV